jgi:hypothetical protein
MCTSHFGTDFEQEAAHDNEAGDGKVSLLQSVLTSSLMGNFPGVKVTRE